MSQQIGERRTPADPHATTEKAALWAAFSSATSIDTRAAAWLELLARRLPSARAACVFRGNADAGPPELMAHWPLGALEAADEFAVSASHALAREVACIRSVGRGFHLMSRADGHEEWVIVMECGATPAPELQSALDEIRWGTGWLIAGIQQITGRDHAIVARRAGGALQILEAAGREREVVALSAALADGIAALVPGTLVTVAVHRLNVLSLAARSGPESEAGEPSRDDRRETIIRAAINSEQSVLRTALDDGPIEAEPGGEPPGTHVSLQLFHPHDGQVAGALLCERSTAAFTEDELAIIETVARLAAPLVDMTPVSRQTAVTRERRMLAGLFGPVRLKWKLVLIALLALVLVLLGATGDYEAPVDATVETAPARRLTAPFEGRLAEVSVRAGDIVKRGQLLARLDDTELQQERSKLIAERDRAIQAARGGDADASASGTAPETPGAKQRDIEARIVILDERLARMQVTSPVDGVVVGGVAPGGAHRRVEATDELFAIAPLDGLRLLLKADAADVPLLREGQSGRVVMTGDAGAVVPFTIKRIVSASESTGDWRVEAQPVGTSAGLAQGAQAQGGVDVGTRKLVWIWWRKLQRETQPARPPAKD